MTKKILLCIIIGIFLIGIVRSDIVSINWGIDNYTTFSSSQIIEGFGFGEIPSVVSFDGGGSQEKINVSYKLNNTICDLLRSGENITLDKELYDFHIKNCPKPKASKYWWIILVIIGLFVLISYLVILALKREKSSFL